tara:strand:+ start:11180 stop:11698 length:519 start_codon:yes stop_codon:yes gene_type:complete
MRSSGQSVCGVVAVTVMALTGCASDQGVGRTPDRFGETLTCPEIVARVSSAADARKAIGLSAYSDGKEIDWEDFTKPPRPNYPKEAAMAGVEGRCDIYFDLSADGVPTNIASACTNGVFTRDAQTAVRAMRVKPYTFEGEPVLVPGIMYPMTFNLEISGREKTEFERICGAQ